MQGLAQQLAAGQLNAATVPIWTLLALALASLGGAAAGLRLGGKVLGGELAALMGILFGPTAVVPAVLVGLIVLSFL